MKSRIETIGGRLIGLLLASLGVLCLPAALSINHIPTASAVGPGPITWDFETGNLSGWSATGMAFNNQPTFGDNIRARLPEVSAGLQGNFFIGTFEDRPNGSRPLGSVQGDEPTGTLTSDLFSANFRQVSFSIGGGADINRVYVAFLFKVTPENRSRFENVREPDGRLFSYPRVYVRDGYYYEIGRTTGRNDEAMRRVTISFANVAGPDDLCRVRIVDNSSGPWGHINVDDFRFEGTLGTPSPAFTLIRVVDERGNAVADAEVFINDEQAAMRTNAAGEIRNRRLNPGDRMVARKRINEHRYWREGHSQGSTQDWNWRLYLTSLTINNDGSATPFVVRDSSLQQVLTLRRDNALIGIHLFVSVEWDANPSEIAELRRHFTEASEFLYNATDGQFHFEQVELATNKAGWDVVSDINIHANNREWPHCDPFFGFYDPLPLGPLTPGPGLIHMPYLPTASNYSGRTPDVYAHEFGHYGFGLYDEYHLGIRCTAATERPGSAYAEGQPRASCLMWNESFAPKLCSGHPDNPHNVFTLQSVQFVNCWTKVVGDYGNPRALGLAEDAYRLKSPDTRGAIPGRLPRMPTGWQTLINVDARPRAGLRSPVELTLRRPDGTPVRRSRVHLRTYYGQDIDQGETNDEGRITIIGAHTGDTVYFEGDSLMIAHLDSPPVELRRAMRQSLLATFRPVAWGQRPDAVHQPKRTAMEHTVVRQVPPLQVELEPRPGGKLQVRVRAEDGRAETVSVTATSGGKDQKVAMSLEAATGTWIGVCPPLNFGEIALSVSAKVSGDMTYAIRRFRLMPFLSTKGHDLYTPDGSVAVTLADEAFEEGEMLILGPATAGLFSLGAKLEIVSGPVSILSAAGGPRKQGKTPNTIRFQFGVNGFNAKQSHYTFDSMRILYLPVGGSEWKELETKLDQQGATAVATAELNALGRFVLVARPARR